MNHAHLTDQSLLRQTMIEVANLPDDDLPILLDIVVFLKQQRAAATAADIGRSARQRAVALRSLPREQLAAQFREIGEKIRSQAAIGGTAIEGDWEGD